MEVAVFLPLPARYDFMVDKSCEKAAGAGYRQDSCPERESLAIVGEEGLPCCHQPPGQSLLLGG
jgi:hypothetical protein